MKYQAIIFDLDGVICHTDNYHYLAWKQIADELQIPFNRKINDRMRGIDRMASLNVLLEGSNRTFSDEQKKQFADRKNGIYRDLLKNLSQEGLDADVKKTLDRVREAGLKLAIGSSSKNTNLILGLLGLSTFFDAVVDGNHITHSKPDPEVFLKAAEQLSVKPKSCLVVEDAKSGLLAAKAAGMDSAGIGEAGTLGMADYALENITDLLKII
jgi:beta-phosphoglucomutase